MMQLPLVPYLVVALAASNSVFWRIIYEQDFLTVKRIEIVNITEFLCHFHRSHVFFCIAMTGNTA